MKEQGGCSVPQTGTRRPKENSERAMLQIKALVRTNYSNDLGNTIE
jgi:hypothetical protein